MDYLKALKDISTNDKKVSEAIVTGESRFIVLRQYLIDLIKRSKGMTEEQFKNDTQLIEKILKCISKLKYCRLTDDNGNDVLTLPIVKAIDLNSNYSLTKYIKQGYKLVFVSKVDNIDIGIMEKQRYKDVQSSISLKQYTTG